MAVDTILYNNGGSVLSAGNIKDIKLEYRSDTLYYTHTDGNEYVLDELRSDARVGYGIEPLEIEVRKGADDGNTPEMTQAKLSARRFWPNAIEPTTGGLRWTVRDDGETLVIYVDYPNDGWEHDWQLKPTEAPPIPLKVKVKRLVS